MDVQVVHTLAAVRAIIYHSAEAILEALLYSNLASDVHAVP